MSLRQGRVGAALPKRHDEAHRSQYGFGGKVNEKTGEMSYGFASNLRDALPNASFIGFTGTPIEKTDAKHIGNKQWRRELANQFKAAKNPFKIVIVREGEEPRRSRLTGFDAPCGERQKVEV